MRGLFPPFLRRERVIDAPPMGQCILTLSGTNLLLSPRDGNNIFIQGAWDRIPSAGIALAPTGLTLSTLYYIYVYKSGTGLSLEASITAYATDASFGHRIKSGDPTRTLVGMARTTAGTAWADSAAQRFVRSYFNDPGIAGLNTFTSDRSTASGAYVELNSEIRVEFLAWANEVIAYAANGSVSNGTSDNSDSAIGFDGTAAEAGSEATFLSTTANFNGSMGIGGGYKTGLAEGYHYATLLGRVNSNTGTWDSASGGQTAKCYVHIASKR